MQNRRSFDQGNQRRTHRGDTGQRNLLLGVGLFVIALIVVGALLLTGNDDTGEPTSSTGGSGLPLATGVTGTASTAGQSAVATVPSSPQALVPGDSTVPSAISTSPAPAQPTATDSIPVEPTESNVVVAEEETVGDDETPTSDEPAVDESDASEESLGESEPDVEPDEDTQELIGEFGKLPPAQIVSGTLSRQLDLTYSLDTAAVSAPQSALVYQLIWPERGVADVQSIADSLGMDASVDDLGGGSFQAIGDATELYVSPDVIQYVNREAEGAGELEDDATIASYAESWLSSNGLVSTSPGAATVMGRDDDAGIAVVFVKPADPSPMFAAFPSASITVTAGGAVQQANIQWPADYASSEYGMKSLNEVWNRVVAGEGAIEANLSDVSGSGVVSGTFTVDEIGVGYSVASGSSGDFLVPLMVFYGTAVADTGESFPMTIYVSAVQGEVSAAG